MMHLIEPKIVDPEAELSNAQRTYKKLAPSCSIKKRAEGIPQLAPQEKQMGILAHEMQETLLCINLARKGQHAVRDSNVKSNMRKSIIDYENMELVLRDERSQQLELDVLNYLAQKNVRNLTKEVSTEADELTNLENAYNRLRRMENRLDLTTKRFCVVHTENKQIREEIHRLLVERNSFNMQWRRTIANLVKGKEYLMDILEIATLTFGYREGYCKKLETLKWKGLYQLNKDIAEMQAYDGELKHLSKLEEFLRTKGSTRICEADEKEEAKMKEEIAECNEEIAWHDALLEEIFSYVDTRVGNLPAVITQFRRLEIENFAIFVHLCEILQEATVLKKDVQLIRRTVLDQRDKNESVIEKQDKKLTDIAMKLAVQRKLTESKLKLNQDAIATFQKLLKGFDDLFRLSQCDITPLLSLLGNHKEVTQWNVHKFIKLLEVEVKSLIQVEYGAVKPPPPPPSQKGTAKKAAPVPPSKVVADPHVEILRPKDIESLIPYLPCAYCVEDYMMNLLYETPAVPADSDYIETMFHLEEVNTSFGIYTLTNPEKRHPFRDVPPD